MDDSLRREDVMHAQCPINTQNSRYNVEGIKPYIKAWVDILHEYNKAESEEEREKLNMAYYEACDVARKATTDLIVSWLEELKPCPACKCERITLDLYEDDRDGDWTEVRCKECGINIREMTTDIDSMLTRWNIRK